MKIKDEYAQAEVPMLPVVIGMQKTSKYILGNTIILLPYSLILSFIPDIWNGSCIHRDCSCFRWFDVSISLQTNKDSYI